MPFDNSPLQIGVVNREIAGDAEDARVGIGNDHRVSENLRGRFGELRKVIGAKERLEHPVAKMIELSGPHGKVVEGRAERHEGLGRRHRHEASGDPKPGRDARTGMQEHDLARVGGEAHLLKLRELAKS